MAQTTVCVARSHASTHCSAAAVPAQRHGAGVSPERHLPDSSLSQKMAQASHNGSHGIHWGSTPMCTHRFCVLELHGLSTSAVKVGRFCSSMQCTRSCNDCAACLSGPSASHCTVKVESRKQHCIASSPVGGLCRSGNEQVLRDACISNAGLQQGTSVSSRRQRRRLARLTAHSEPELAVSTCPPVHDIPIEAVCQGAASFIVVAACVRNIPQLLACWKRKRCVVVRSALVSVQSSKRDREGRCLYTPWPAGMAVLSHF